MSEYRFNTDQTRVSLGERTWEAVEDNTENCENCAFYRGIYRCPGTCFPEKRKDGRHIVWKETEHKRRPSFRIVCDINGDFRVEVLDKPINYWYIVASKMGRGKKGFMNAVEHCKKYIQEDEQ